MIKRILALTIVASVASSTVGAQKLDGNASAFRTTVNGKTVFKVAKPDKATSPITGMTRKHWQDAALYLLQGAFSYVHQLDDPMKFPKQPGISYPRNDGQVPTEMLEGLCRTLFIAAPLLREDSNLTIGKIRVADYYRHQLLNMLDSTKPTYIRHRSKNGGPSQILVEYGALAVSLFSIPEIIWQPLAADKKEALAATMLSYGDGPSIGNNWKFFNVFVLSFFKSQGYTVNDKLLEEYLQKSLAHYRGDGWYNDAPAYDYYSMWAFQMYGMLWSEFFGKKHYPAYAEAFAKNFSPLKDNYPYMFSRNGEMIMWGRSMSYRMGAAIPFPLTGFQNDPSTNYGWMRRIASGTLLQFLQHPDFLKDNVPTLGFYGAFEPTVQPYSCRGSAFWMGKAFLGLLVPANNPFWTAKENEGAWATELKKGQVYNKLQDSSHILITDYPNIGAAEIRAWCNAKRIGAWEIFRSSENYNRLSYNSAFPWQADSVEGVAAMNYIVKNKKHEWEPFRLYDFKKYTDGVYYRDVTLETNPAVRFSLADITLPNGILRVDKNNSTDTVELRLGHYALPKLKGKFTLARRMVKGKEVAIVSNDVYQLAMVTLNGWDTLQTTFGEGAHPQATSSALINVRGKFIPGSAKPPFHITLMLWKKAGEKWTDEELVPVKNITYASDNSHVLVDFYNADSKKIVF